MGASFSLQKYTLSYATYQQLILGIGKYCKIVYTGSYRNKRARRLKASQLVHWYHHPEDIDPKLLEVFEPETVQEAGKLIEKYGLEEARTVAQIIVRTHKPYGVTQQDWLRWKAISTWLQQCSDD